MFAPPAYHAELRDVEVADQSAALLKNLLSGQDREDGD